MLEKLFVVEFCGNAHETAQKNLNKNSGCCLDMVLLLELNQIPKWLNQYQDFLFFPKLNFTFSTTWIFGAGFLKGFFLAAELFCPGF